MPATSRTFLNRGSRQAAVRNFATQVPWLGPRGRAFRDGRYLVRRPRAARVGRRAPWSMFRTTDAPALQVRRRSCSSPPRHAPSPRVGPQLSGAKSASMSIRPHTPMPNVQNGFVGACYQLTLALRYRAQDMALHCEMTPPPHSVNRACTGYTGSLRANGQM